MPRRSEISLAYLGRCGCGHGKDDGVAESFDRWSELEVIGAEIVTPFADAVRFVHHEERNACIEERFDSFLLSKLLRREKDVFAATVLDLFHSLASFRDALGGVDDDGVSGILGIDRIHLVLLQSNERRDYECRTLGHQSRELVNGGFPGAGRLHNESIFAGEESAYSVFLSRTKGLKPEILLGYREDVVLPVRRSFLSRRRTFLGGGHPLV